MNLTKAPSLKGLTSSGEYTKRSQERLLLLSIVAGRVYVTADKHLDGFYYPVFREHILLANYFTAIC